MLDEKKRFIRAQIVGGLVVIAAYFGVTLGLETLSKMNIPVARTNLPSTQLEHKIENNEYKYRFAKGYDKNLDGKIDEIRINGQTLGDGYEDLQDYQEAITALEKARN